MQKSVMAFAQNDQIVYTVAIILITLLLVLLVYYLIYEIRKGIIKKTISVVSSTSQRLSDIRKINLQYDFHNLNSQYIFLKMLNSKQQFDKFDFDKFFDTCIEENRQYIKELITKADENADKYSRYRKEKFSPLLSKEQVREYKVSYRLYTVYEEQLTKEEIRHPITTPSYVCKISYTSPRGRNSYSAHKEYSIDQIKFHYEKVCNEINARDTKEYQRKIMTDSLRYDIMQRDSFRCVLCGRTVEDGIKLHVDHIIPVSKGGKTEASNLRTLCSECNMGKRDKYDECGVN